jgi:hypothetical protein
MKLTKVAYCVMAATLAAGVYSAKATAPSVTTNYLKLSFSITINQQVLSDTNKNGDGKTFVWTTKTMKVGNKELLSLLSEAAKTTWTNAQLEYDFNSEQVVVADKTGTNILAYCNPIINDGTNYAYLSFDPYNHDGPFTETLVDAAPGSIKYTENYKGELAVYYSTNLYTMVSFSYASGKNVDTFSQKWDSNNFGAWNESFTFTPTSNGTVDNVNEAQLTGKVTGKGKGSAVRQDL